MVQGGFSVFEIGTPSTAARLVRRSEHSTTGSATFSMQFSNNDQSLVVLDEV